MLEPSARVSRRRQRARRVGLAFGSERRRGLGLGIGIGRERRQFRAGSAPHRSALDGEGDLASPAAAVGIERRRRIGVGRAVRRSRLRQIARQRHRRRERRRRDARRRPAGRRASSGACAPARQTSATWELFVGHRSAPVDTSYGATLDLDGDGVPDVAACAAAAASPSSSAARRASARAPAMLANPDGAERQLRLRRRRGRRFRRRRLRRSRRRRVRPKGGDVHVYFGGAGGAGDRAQALDAPDGMSGFGCRLAAAGDLDGDGYADLAMARIGQDFSGGLYIYRGGAGGLPATTTRIDSPDYKPSRLGYSLAGVGDLDGDGFDDLVATEIDYSAASGRAHVYLGGPGGITNATSGDAAQPRRRAGCSSAPSVAGVGDVDGDGHPDFVVASPAVSTTTLHAHGAPLSRRPRRRSPRARCRSISQLSGVDRLRRRGRAGRRRRRRRLRRRGGRRRPMAIVLFRGGAGRRRASGRAIDAAGQGINPRHLAGAGDLDGDGRDDLVGRRRRGARGALRRRRWSRLRLA